MPVAVDPGDRKLLLIAGGILFALSAAFVLFAPNEPGSSESAPSTYSGTPGGARAAFLLLQELHYYAERWERSPIELPSSPGPATLILADPLVLPGKQESEALRRFVENGGRILFAGSMVGLFFSEAKTAPSFASEDWRTFSATLPSALSRDAHQIALRPQAEWHYPSPPFLPLYGSVDTAVVVRWKIGKGEVFWWAAPSPLTNAGLLRDGNLNLFLHSVDPPTPQASAPRPRIYWDEYFHGQRSSLWSYIGKTPLPWGLAQLGILGVAVILAYSRRSGPIAMPPRVSRLSPLEFVDTLGGLYERAGAAPAAVSVALQRFRALLTRQLRLSSTVADRALEEAARQRLAWKGDELFATLQRAAAACRDVKLESAEALQIVRKLQDLEIQLGLKKQKPREKT